MVWGKGRLTYAPALEDRLLIAMHKVVSDGRLLLYGQKARHV